MPSNFAFGIMGGSFDLSQIGCELNASWNSNIGDILSSKNYSGKELNKYA